MNMREQRIWLKVAFGADDTIPRIVAKARWHFGHIARGDKPDFLLNGRQEVAPGCIHTLEERKGGGERETHSPRS